MTTWTECFEKHNIHDSLKGARERIDAIDPDAEDDVAAVERLKKVISKVGRILEQSDPDVVTTPMLDGISSHLQQIVAQLDQFQSNGNVAHLAEANTAADRVLDNCRWFPTAILDEDAEATRAGIATLDKEGLEQLLRHIVSAVESKHSAFRSGGCVQSETSEDLALGVMLEQMEKEKESAAPVTAAVLADRACKEALNAHAKKDRHRRIIRRAFDSLMGDGTPLSGAKPRPTLDDKADPSIKPKTKTLKDLMHEHKVPSLTALADLTGVNLSRLSLLKTGQATPFTRPRKMSDKSEVEKLAEFFGISESELLAMF